LSTLTRAFKLLIDRGLKHTLVIAGRKGWFYDDLFKTIEDLNLKAEVILTGYIPDEELPFLYNAADLFVYPSLYEGFGLPVLEAMACGVPVITSNISSLPEIVGAAGVLVNPNEINELADKIYNVLTDRQFHDELGNEGLARSRLFSWARTAKETLAVYRQVLNAR
jgi:glycosyltransferase involved in cell wall biosynthesis